MFTYFLLSLLFLLTTGQVSLESDHISNIVVIHNESCSTTHAITYTDIGNIHNVPVTQYSPEGCLLNMDFLYDTDEVTGSPFITNITTNVTNYYIIDTPAIIRTGPSEEQYLIKNISISSTFTVDIALYRAPLTNHSCATPQSFNVNISSTCSFQATFFTEDTANELFIYRFTTTKTELLNCNELTPINYSHNYLLEIGNTTTYRTDGVAWSTNHNTCDSRRPFVNDSVAFTVNLLPTSSGSSTLVEQSTFRVVPESIDMDVSVCDGAYASPVSTLRFDVEILFPPNVTVEQNEIYFLHETLGPFIVLEKVGNLTCTGQTCIQSYRTLDCLPVMFTTSTQCTFDLTNMRLHLTAVRAVMGYYEMSETINPVIPFESFTSGTCPQLVNVQNVNDVFPPIISVDVDGSDIVTTMTIQNGGYVSLEFIDVEVSLYTPDNVLWGTQIFNKGNKLKGMTLTHSPYYNDAHFCRHECLPFYNDSRADLLGSNGLFPKCVLPTGSTAAGTDIFTFNPQNWVFQSYSHNVGLMIVQATANLYVCDPADTAFSPRQLLVSNAIVQSESISIQYRFSGRVSYLPIAIVLLPLYHMFK